MKSLHLILSVLLFFCFSLKAEEQFRERVFVHTDKDCYISGEDILLKFYVVNNQFQPSTLSKVGYVEICNTEKPLMQLKVALEKGGGAGKIRIPRDLPSGIYQLSGYTRYMRNEGENVFFRKQIAIINAVQETPDPKRYELVEKQETSYPEKKETLDLLVKTNQKGYGNRQKVLLSIDNIPDHTADLIVSVSRNDSIAFVQEVNKPEWLKQVSDTFHFSGQWPPEYEGHIIPGRFIPEPQENLLASIAVVGKDIRFRYGQVNEQNQTINFYTAGIFGKQQIVTSALSLFHNKTAHRIDLISPFCEFLPDNLPVMQVRLNEKQILDRYIGVQIQGKMNNDVIDNLNQIFNDCSLQPVLSYDLDEYTRFSTISETILEFISQVRVVKVEGKRRISVFSAEQQQFSPRRVLVLLDGVPIYDHEDILNYNPMYIKRINVYDKRYLLGGNDYEGIVYFITREGDLPFFQLSNESQLLNYDFPQLPPLFLSPDYSTDPAKNSRKPDFRHTLYWNPFVEYTYGKPVNLSFYTSDLCGEFKVIVEGITSDGKMIKGVSYFRVPESH